MISALAQSGILFLFVFPNFVFACTFFGFFTALTAHLLGDTTPKNEGFLTLNPMAHVDLQGSLIFIGVMLLANSISTNPALTSIVFLVLLFSNLRRMIPVSITSQNFKNPKTDEALSLLAGPLGAMFYSFLTFLCMRIPFLTYAGISAAGSLQNLIWTFLTYGSTLGIFIGVLTLIPLPPQTGGEIVLLLIPEEHEEIIEWYSTYGWLILLGLLVIPGTAGGFSNILMTITQGIRFMFHSLVFFNVT